MTDFTSIDKCLDAAVLAVVGSPVGPRPGQKMLAHDIWSAMEGNGTNMTDDAGNPIASRGRLTAVAGTGVGKTLAGLVPAFVRAVEYGERTVVSTESLALQAQILDKDAPVFAEAVGKALGSPAPTFAVLKGFSNYVCSLAAHEASIGLLEATGASVSGLESDTISKHASESERASQARAVLRATRSALETPTKRKASSSIGAAFGKGKSETVALGDRTVDRDVALPLLKWSLDQASDPNGHGDKSKYDGDTSGGVWSEVSIAPAECPGASECPFGEVCLPRKGRTAAAEADVVVTNHSILAIQANVGAPVVFGNRTLGDFDHLIVDECHALPKVVRNSGGKEISARRIYSVTKAYERLVDPTVVALTALAAEGQKLTTVADAVFGDEVKGHAPGEKVTFDPEHNPFESVGAEIESWAKRAAKALPDEAKVSDTKTRLKLKRVKSQLDALASDAKDMTTPNVEHARWVEKPFSTEGFIDNMRWTGATFKISPVDVSGAVSANLFRAPVWFDDPEEARLHLDDDGNPPMKPLSVSMMSATVPAGFSREVGLMTRTKDYPTPFDSAYGSSMLYVPRVATEEQLRKIAKHNGRKWVFDISKHRDWAFDQMLELVRANEGHALILSAKKTDGEHYAKMLRLLCPDIPVYSQWDGRDSRQIVAQWRDHTESVLVGTRSMMTGVDAAGATNSLVIIDRIPRDPSNVVDDARVKLLMENAGLDKWAAERLVYVSDAQERLEQAAGRLIRSTSDKGLLALLEPRMVPNTPLAYPKATQDMYLHGLRKFSNRKSKLSTAVEFLKTQAAERKAA